MVCMILLPLLCMFDDALIRGAAHLVFTLLTVFRSDIAVGGHVRWALTVLVIITFRLCGRVTCVGTVGGNFLCRVFELASDTVHLACSLLIVSRSLRSGRLQAARQGVTPYYVIQTNFKVNMVAQEVKILNLNLMS